jgi:hypothetical protein
VVRRHSNRLTKPTNHPEQFAFDPNKPKSPVSQSIILKGIPWSANESSVLKFLESMGAAVRFVKVIYDRQTLRIRCGSQKCENSNFFFCFFFLYIYFSILSFTPHQKITIRLNNWTLRFNSPLVTTEESLEHTWINTYPTMDNISQGFHQSQLQPSSYSDTLSTVQPHNYIQLFLFHFYILHHTCRLN